MSMPACNADICEFAAHGCLQQNSQTYVEDLSETIQMLLLPEEYGEGELCDDPKDPIELNGWTWTGREVVGKDKKLSGYCWEKDDLKVHLLNEDQYESVGEFDIAVASNDRKSIETFIREFRLDKKIEESSIVKCWS